MASVMLFCTAEEAKPFLPEIMKPPKSGVRIFGLVESLTVPKNMEEMRNELHEGEPIHSPFIGASEDECESWAQEINYPVTNIIAIADARTGQDGTILICYHSSDYQEDWPNFGGSLPPQPNTWYNWRIKPEDAEEVVDSFLFGDELRFPTYFGMKEQLTDENGVFNAGKAAVYMGGKDPETGEMINPCYWKPPPRYWNRAHI